MANLIDKLTPKVDRLRQKAADKFGLPAHNMYRVIRTWSGGELGNGTPADAETLITPTPKIDFTTQHEFKPQDRLDPHGRVDDRGMTATGVSLTFTEDFLQGESLSPGQECFYKLVERNSQGADTTYWQLATTPIVLRNKLSWELHFTHYTVC